MVTKISLAYALAGLVDGTFPRFSPRNKLLHAEVDMKFSHYRKNDQDIELSRTFHIFFQRPSNYTKVFSWVIDPKQKGLPLLTKLKQIYMECDHDSCWRDTGFKFIDKILIDAWDFFRNMGVERKDISEFISFGICSPQFIKADIEPIKKHDHYPRDWKFKFRGDWGTEDEINHLNKVLEQEKRLLREKE